MIGTIEKVKELLLQPHPLMIAGTKKTLEQLPAGNWIGGTIPFLVDQSGKRLPEDQLEITRIAGSVSKAIIKVYDLDNIHQIRHEGFKNGFSMMIVPAESRIHHSFAMNSSVYPAADKNILLGWVAGYQEDQENQAYVIFGPKKKFLTDQAVSIHYKLREGFIPKVEKQNCFVPSDGPDLKFPQSGFSTDKIEVQGKSMKIKDFLKQYDIDYRFPLIRLEERESNVSLKKLEGDRLHFYAPIFKNQRYRWSRLASEKKEPTITDPVFSCNCILNHIENSVTLCDHRIPGPVTFGEISENLLNQTSLLFHIKKDQNQS